VSEPLTDEELAAIKARAEAATVGPWYVQSTTACFLNIHGGDRTTDGRFLAQMGYDPPANDAYFDDGEPQYDGADRDADFIAHARTDVPALVAEVKRLRGEVAWRDAERE